MTARHIVIVVALLCGGCPDSITQESHKKEMFERCLSEAKDSDERQRCGE